MKNKPSGQSFCIFATRNGEAMISWRDKKVCSLRLPTGGAVKPEKCSIAEFWQKSGENEAPGSIKKVISRIRDYYQGEAVSFKDVPIYLEGLSPFICNTLRNLQNSEWGETLSYKQLAEICGDAKGARATGKAVSVNPIPLIIPCHRVICSDGKIGGFSAAGGTKSKVEMLKLEDHLLSETEPAKLLPPMTFASMNLQSALKHLCQADKDLARFIKIAPEFNLQPDHMVSSFQALLEAIVYQQLTGKAAATIFSRLLGLFGSSGNVAPLDIIRAGDNEMRSAGLSGAKVAAARDLAEFAISGNLPDLSKMQRLPNMELIRLLTRIKGIGQWTVEMLLMFKLGRADIIAANDYGLQKGLAAIRRQKQLPSAKELKEQSAAWKPYRSVASWYLWRAAENL